MPKLSHRSVILLKGLEAVRQHGYCATSVRDIVQAAQVPQGSFTNHFSSKEAFGVEILNLEFTRMEKLLTASLGDADLQPLQRLQAFVDGRIDWVSADNVRDGCLFGNLAAELRQQNRPIHNRLLNIFEIIQQMIRACVAAAVSTQAISARPDGDIDALSAYILSSFQGAILIAQAQRSTLPLWHFKHVLFDKILC